MVRWSNARRWTLCLDCDHLGPKASLEISPEPLHVVAEMARMARNMLENSVMVMPGVRVKSAKLNHIPRAVAKRSFFQGLLAKRHTQEMGEWKNVLRGMGKPLS